MRKNDVILIVVSAFFLGFPGGPVIQNAMADELLSDGTNRTLEEYSNLKDQNKLLREKEKNKELEDKVKKKAGHPGYPAGYPGYSPYFQGARKEKKEFPYSIYSVSGIDRNLRAVIMDRDGVIYYVHQGDHLPGGFSVWRLKGDSVVLRKDHNLYSLGFKIEQKRRGFQHEFIPPPPAPPMN